MTEFRSELVKVSSQFDNFDQHDGMDCLRTIIDALHEDLNRIVSERPVFTYTDKDVDKLNKLGRATLSWKRQKSIGNSIVSEIFAGQIESIIKCATCGFESATYDAFFDLSVPIPTKRTGLSLVECLEDYTKLETLDAEWKCSTCKLVRVATKQVLISHLPDILVVQLNRFDFKYGCTRKINNTVEIPTSKLKMEQFLSQIQLEQDPQVSTYELFGTVNHMGVAGGGHYNAFVKYGDEPGWFVKDDSSVRGISESEAQSKAVYILFYRRNSS
jgi:ubiquitin C-terminal hydrolase